MGDGPDCPGNVGNRMWRRGGSLSSANSSFAPGIERARALMIAERPSSKYLNERSLCGDCWFAPSRGAAHASVCASDDGQGKRMQSWAKQ
eukprot:3774510-Pleurochrysis_carterae.AAC.1